MTRLSPVTLALTLGSLALASCSETPTQPQAAGDLSAAVSSLALPSNSWTAKAPLPAGPSTPDGNTFFGQTLGAAINSAGQRIAYVFGGDFDGFSSVRIFAYNLTTNTWSGRNAEFSGSGTNGVGKIGGLLYISGGRIFLGEADGLMNAELRAYDPAGDRIIRKANMPRATADGVTGVLNDKLYVLSGDCDDEIPPVFECEDPVVRRLLYRYDPATNTWVTLAPAPHSHKQGAGGFINGKFYVAGGATNTLDVYDPFANTWTTLAPLPSPREVGAIMRSKLWMIGASGSNRSTYVYDPVTNRWSKKAPFPTGQSSPSAAVLFSLDDESHILTVGSYQGPNFSPAPSQLYTP